jgi:hypothetical protein
MSQVFQNLEALAYDIMTGQALDVRYKAYTASIALLARII